jgi:hypothetical protein
VTDTRVLFVAAKPNKDPKVVVLHAKQDQVCRIGSSVVTPAHFLGYPRPTRPPSLPLLSTSRSPPGHCCCERVAWKNLPLGWWLAEQGIPTSTVTVSYSQPPQVVPTVTVNATLSAADLAAGAEAAMARAATVTHVAALLQAAGLSGINVTLTQPMQAAAAPSPNAAPAPPPSAGPAQVVAALICHLPARHKSSLLTSSQHFVCRMSRRLSFCQGWDGGLPLAERRGSSRPAMQPGFVVFGVS